MKLQTASGKTVNIKKKDLIWTALDYALLDGIPVEGDVCVFTRFDNGCFVSNESFRAAIKELKIDFV